MYVTFVMHPDDGWFKVINMNIYALDISNCLQNKKILIIIKFIIPTQFWKIYQHYKYFLIFPHKEPVFLQLQLSQNAHKV